jgi:competence protein ComEA
MSKKRNKKLISTIIVFAFILVVIIILIIVFQKITEPTEQEVITKININNADIEKLIKLPGIGQIKAKAIMNYRENIGGFKSLKELTKVKGIGKKTFEKILPYIETIGDSTEIIAFIPDSLKEFSGKININTASLTELISLPSIGEKRAQKIINYRNEAGNFNNTKDIMKVKGIGEGIYTNIKDMIEISD